MSWVICERSLHGGVNSGRNVNTSNSLVVGICSIKRSGILMTTGQPSVDLPTLIPSLVVLLGPLTIALRLQCPFFLLLWREIQWRIV